MLEGMIAVHIDAKVVRLREGDCLDFDVIRGAETSWSAGLPPQFEEARR